MAPVELPDDIFEHNGKYYLHLGNGTHARHITKPELEEILRRRNQPRTVDPTTRLAPTHQATLAHRTKPSSYQTSTADDQKYDDRATTAYPQERSAPAYSSRKSEREFDLRGSTQYNAPAVETPAYATYSSGRGYTTRDIPAQPRRESAAQPSRTERNAPQESNTKDPPQLRGTQRSYNEPRSSTVANPRTSSSAIEQQANYRDEEDVSFNVLRGVERRFAMVDPSDFDAYADFIEDNEDILYKRPGNFLQEAITFMANKNNEWVRRCLQCCLIIRTCNKESKPDRATRLVRKLGKDTPEAITFREEMSTLLAGIKTNQSAPVSANIARPRAETPREERKPSTTATLRGSQAATVAQPLSQVRRSTQTSETRPSAIINDEATLENMSAYYGEAPIVDDEDVDVPDVDPEDKSRNQKVIRYLNRSYKKRSGHWFIPGKVFAILWHENAGSNAKQKEISETLDDPVLARNISKGPYQEYVYSHIRRMVVIKNRQGYCWCLPINTYGGRGLAKSGLKPQEKSAHAIIHDRSKAARTVKNETAPAKKPIAVDMTDGETLQAASRINFAKPYTVEWNVKVMDVGQVADSSLPYLILQAKKELFDS